MRVAMVTGLLAFVRVSMIFCMGVGLWARPKETTGDEALHRKELSTCFLPSVSWGRRTRQFWQVHHMEITGGKTGQCSWVWGGKKRENQIPQCFKSTQNDLIVPWDDEAPTQSVWNQVKKGVTQQSTWGEAEQHLEQVLVLVTVGLNWDQEQDEERSCADQQGGAKSLPNHDMMVYIISYHVMSCHTLYYAKVVDNPQVKWVSLSEFAKAIVQNWEHVRKWHFNN